MADYWKSNAKKYCDFCKCWIADNKPSIEFHEKGKRHKENVAVRLKNISRQSAKDYKVKQKLNEDLKKMEKAALEAYLKDVERNADYTSQELNKQLGLDHTKESCSTSGKGADEKESEKIEEQKPESKMSSLWYEAVSEEGHTYYWNTETGESLWEPPKEGYLSLDEQKKLEKEDKKNEERRKVEEAKREKEHDKMKAEERRAFMEREKMKERAKKELKEVPEIKSSGIIGPAPRGNPYGSWTVVKVSNHKPVDLQLPEKSRVEIKTPVVNVNEPEIKFKEKCIETLESEGGSDTSFKKRKLHSASKRNMRKRLDDD